MNRKLIAILRGVKPSEVVDIASVLIDAGIDTIEIPLNSPQPLESIARLVDRFEDRARIGAGTVLSTADVEQVAAVGGRLVLSPNCSPNVIRATRELGMDSYPGVFSATECFTALDCGATGLKFFPAFLLGCEGLKALKAVLPNKAETYAVGGVGAENFADWFAVGITGFGIGSAIYKPGDSVEIVAKRAQAIIAAYKRSRP